MIVKAIDPHLALICAKSFLQHHSCLQHQTGRMTSECDYAESGAIPELCIKPLDNVQFPKLCIS